MTFKKQTLKYLRITYNTMTDTTISLRIDKNLHAQMKQFEYINWSALLRKSLKELIAQQKAENARKKEFDEEKIKRAVKNIDAIRESGIFDGGKTGVEIIREWRNKRRF